MLAASPRDWTLRQLSSDEGRRSSTSAPPANPVDRRPPVRARPAACRWRSVGQAAPRAARSTVLREQTGWRWSARWATLTGVLAVIRLPEPFDNLASTRGYLPAGALLIKRVAAGAGDLVCPMARSSPSTGGPWLWRDLSIRRGSRSRAGAAASGSGRPRSSCSRPIPIASTAATSARSTAAMCWVQPFRSGYDLHRLPRLPHWRSYAPLARAQALVPLEMGPENELERLQKLLNAVDHER